MNPVIDKYWMKNYHSSKYWETIVRVRVSVFFQKVNFKTIKGLFWGERDIFKCAEVKA